MEFPSNSEVAGMVALAIVAILFALKALGIRLRYVLLPAAAIAMAIKGFGSTGVPLNSNYPSDTVLGLTSVALMLLVTIMMRFFPRTLSMMFGFFRLRSAKR